LEWTGSVHNAVKMLIGIDADKANRGGTVGSECPWISVRILWMGLVDNQWLMKVGKYEVLGFYSFVCLVEQTN
jgi:hypothetical protein